MNLVEEDLITWCGRAACVRVSLVAGGAGAGRPLLHHRALRVGAAGAAGAWVRIWGFGVQDSWGFGGLAVDKVENQQSFNISKFLYLDV